MESAGAGGGPSIEQVAAERAGLRGFFDPKLTAGGEYADLVYGRRETLLQPVSARP